MKTSMSLSTVILIHELDRNNTRKIEIHYSFVGQVDTEQEPTQVVNHDRRNMVDSKKYRYLTPAKLHRKRRHQ